jgi:hypothetical protein
MTLARFTVLTIMLDYGKGKPKVDSVDMKINVWKLLVTISVKLMLSNA